MSEYMNFLERNWWRLLVRGVAAILFGIVAFAWPALTAALLVVMFGAYVLADGIFGIADVSTTGGFGFSKACWVSSSAV